MTPAQQAAQRTSALAAANQVRTHCCRFKKDLSGMSQDDAINAAIDLLDDITRPEAAMPVRHLLYAVPNVKTHKATVILRRADVMNADRRVRDLTLRQRRALADVLDRRGWYR